MKIWEIDLTEGNQYSCEYGHIWEVKNGDLLNGTLEVGKVYTARELLKTNFKKVKKSGWV